MPRGRFVTLEGGEGVGKSVNLALSADYLRSRGLDVVMTREPGGTALGDAVRTFLMAPENTGLSAVAELLLLFAARSEHLRQRIIPALNQGKWVLCDRFTDASFAYQGGGRGIERRYIAFLERWIQGGMEPDMTLLLDAPVAVGRARLDARGGGVDRFESETNAFHERVRTAYLDLAARNPGRIRVIDAAKSLGDVQTAIRRNLDRLVSA